MMPQDSPTSNAGQDSLYVLLSLSSRMLLLPQNDIRTLESVLDVHTSEPPAHGIGWLQFANTHWPVYALDETLQPLPAIPPTQRICVLLSFEDGYFGLTCTNATTLRGTEHHMQPIRPAMLNPESPLCGLTLWGDHIGLMSTASALAQSLRLGATMLSPVAETAAEKQAADECLVMEREHDG